MGSIRLRRTTITVTMRCTLKCKLCSAGVTEYGEPPHYSAEYIAEELNHYFQVVDYVDWLQYSGGEPFLNKDLPQMVEEAMRYKNQFDKLMIFANGTVLPTEKMISTFNKYSDNIHFFFSNYGNVSSRGSELIDCFEQNHFSYSQKKYYGEDQLYGGWVDFGCWERRGRTIEELTKAFSMCGMHTMGFTVVQNGQMHLCRRSYHGMNFGYIERNDTDCIDIMSKSISVEEKRTRLRNMLQLPYIQACDFCNATYGSDDNSVRYQPAEQLTVAELRKLRRNYSAH